MHATCPNKPEPVDFIIPVATVPLHVFTLLQKWDIRVIIVTGLWAGCTGNCGLIPSKAKRFICIFRKHPHHLWDPPSCLMVIECSRWIMKLTAHSLTSAKVTNDRAVPSLFSLVSCMHRHFTLYCPSTLCLSRTVLLYSNSTLIHITELLYHNNEISVTESIYIGCSVAEKLLV